VAIHVEESENLRWPVSKSRTKFLHTN